MPALLAVFTFCRLASIMPGCDGQTQQYFIFQQRCHIHMFLCQNGVEIFLVVIQLIETGLITQQQTHFMLYCIIKRTKTTLATQPATAMKTDIQYRTAQMIHPALQDIIQNTLRAVQPFLQTRQLGKRHLCAYPLAVAGKIQAIYVGSCVHEPRILYFLQHSVKIL